MAEQAVKTLFVLLLLAGLTNGLHAADNGQDCKCPEIKVATYDMKINFALSDTDNNSIATGYVLAQNAGDWLQATLQRQSSDELKISGAGFRPFVSVRRGNVFPSTDPPSAETDFYIEPSVDKIGHGRGAPTFVVSIELKDVITRAGIIPVQTRVIADLNNIDEAVDACIAQMGPLLKVIRDYQKRKRQESNFEKLISAKWKATPQKANIKVHEETQVEIKLFDCDGEPLKNKEVKLVVNDPSMGTLSQANVTTDGNGIAHTTFKAADKSGTANVYVDYDFTTIANKQGSATRCGSVQQIYITIPYILTVDVQIKIRGEDEGRRNGHGEWSFNGEAPLDLEVSAEDTCGKWVFLNGNQITFKNLKGILYGKLYKDNAAANLISPTSFTSGISFTMDSCAPTSQATVHFERLGPPEEVYQKPGTMPAGVGEVIQTMMVGLFHGTMLQQPGGAVAAEQDKLAGLRQIAAQLQAAQANPALRNDPKTVDAYKKLSSQNYLQQYGRSAVMSFDFKSTANKNSQVVFDYTAQLDPAAGMADKAQTAIVHIMIKKSN